MSKFQDMTIKQMMEDVNNRLFLPDIQRGVVWSEDQIINLFDSILRGYPIGTFLFWRVKSGDIKSNALNFQIYKIIEEYDERTPYSDKQDIDGVNVNELQIVLDGQQRLTALYLGLKGSRTTRRYRARLTNPNAFKPKKLYLNLLHDPDPNNPDDKHEFQFHENKPNSDLSQYWFKVGDILDIQSIHAYCNKNFKDMDSETQNGMAKILEDLQRVICSDSIIAYYQETEPELEKVLNIFIRVNSGGTSLSYSDLLMSILTANFTTDIRKEMEEKVIDFRKRFPQMGRDQILKTCLLLTGCPHSFQLKNFSRENIEKIEKEWEKIISNIGGAMELLKDFGFEEYLSSGYIITTIAYYLYKFGQLRDDDEPQILQFVRYAQIRGYFGSSVDTKLTNIKRAMEDKKTVNFKNFSNYLAEQNWLKITTDDIEEMMEKQYGTTAVLPILQILYPNLNYKNTKFHIDHIYPKSKFNNPDVPNNYKGSANSLWNLQLLEGSENNAKRAKDPEVWLQNLSPEEQKDYKKRNYIDPDFELKWGNITKYHEMRRKNMTSKLKEIILNEKER